MKCGNIASDKNCQRLQQSFWMRPYTIIYGGINFYQKLPLSKFSIQPKKIASFSKQQIEKVPLAICLWLFSGLSTKLIADSSLMRKKVNITPCYAQLKYLRWLHLLLSHNTYPVLCLCLNFKVFRQQISFTWKKFSCYSGVPIPSLGTFVDLDECSAAKSIV